MAEPYPFRNLVFEGGGVKGIAYVGALEELDKRDIFPNIERVGGTSAGAINAVLVGLGYDLAETKSILEGLDFKRFMDDSWGLIRDARRVVDEYGLYKGDFFHNWIGDVIADKTGSPDTTFRQLRQLGYRDLYFLATNLSTRFAETYSVQHTPQTRLADAVRMSMSIPLFFAAVRDGVRGDVYVDGGVFNNYPVKLFDREEYIDPSLRASHGRPTDYYDEENERRGGGFASPRIYNRETLGFRLDTKEKIDAFAEGDEPVVHEIDDFVDYAVSLVRAVMSVQDNQHLHSDDWQRTIYIDSLGVRSTDFNLDPEKKAELVEQGRIGVREFFDWYDKETGKDAPVSRPDYLCPA